MAEIAISHIFCYLGNHEQNEDRKYAGTGSKQYLLPAPGVESSRKTLVLVVSRDGCRGVDRVWHPFSFTA